MKVNFFSTSRYIEDGSSKGNYANFNLADHTGDDKFLVNKNRELLVAKYNLAKQPKWLEQTHSTICLDDEDNGNFADSIITTKINNPIAVLTADCLPIFAYTKNNNIVGVSHCGWQGLYRGVIDGFISKFKDNNIGPQDLIIYFAPALSQKNFEVDSKFYNDFISINSDYKTCFIKSDDKYKFDIYKAATINLVKLGVLIKNINSSNDCTYDNPNLFSYRKDGANSGRQAHIIYLTNKLTTPNPIFPL